MDGRNPATDDNDVYGAILSDLMAGQEAAETVEHEDGLTLSYDAAHLVAPFADWDNAAEVEAVSLIAGRTLDVGAGGGRVSLHLQERGVDVVAVDSSPGAAKWCRKRGVTDVRVTTIDQLGDIDTAGQPFGTVVMYGQNFGLLRSPADAQAILADLTRVTTPDAQIIANTFDPHTSDWEEDRAYHAAKLAQGQLPGQTRVRVTYRDLTTDWTDWLQVSRDEMRDVLDGTAWYLADTIGDSGNYLAVIKRR